jgi:putative FmdB family regulatory protein
MPLYEYQCDDCANRFERIQKFSDPPVDKCPRCGGVVRKLISSPAIQFKGSGWYITDYAKKSGPATGASKGEGSGDKAPTSDAQSSSTSDAATKTDSAAPKTPTTSSS